MNDVLPTSPALQGYLDKWLAVQPHQRVALTFVDANRYPGHIALAALEQELLATAYGIAEPQVASAKLGWWAEELSGAPASGGRHPLTQALFAQPQARQIDSALWLAPLTAAMTQMEQGTAADFEAQIEAATPFHAALAALETAWWYGPEASSERASRVATLNHVLYALRRMSSDADQDRLPLPMARLARYGLSRGDLNQPGDARQQAVRAQLRDLLDGWRVAERMAGPVSVFRTLESRQARRLAQRAVRGSDSLAVLQAGVSRPGFGTVLQAWRMARRWRQGLVEPA